MVNPLLALGLVALTLSVGAAGSSMVTLAAQGGASGSPWVILPEQACGAGTQHAHESIPPTLPNGNVTPGHSHVPMVRDGNCTVPRGAI